jgi:GT2 family glycosyltransferase
VTPATPETSSRAVAICVATLGRPNSLVRCLEGISRLVPADDVAIRVLVVDNDHRGPARDVVDRVRQSSPWPIDYVIEPVRGIPQARNRALARTVGADAVAFIDDDEVPQPLWLQAIVRRWRRGGADVLIGPSVPVFDVEPPGWVRDGAFFEPPRHPDDSPLPYWFCRTSGVLIDRGALPDGPEVFDERFRFTGGSDTDLFERMARQGRTFTWVADALIDQLVPPTRATPAWLAGRAYRIGSNRSLFLLARGASRPRLIASTVIHAPAAIVRARPNLRRGRSGLVRFAQVLAEQAGQITGAVGIRHHPYRRPDGS